MSSCRVAKARLGRPSSGSGDCCSVHEDGDDFGFQYVPVNEFKHIIKDVKRHRNHDKDEAVWTTFINEQEQLISNSHGYQVSEYGTSRTLAQSLEDVDRELMRLKADSVPEINYGVGININNNEQEQLTKYLKKDSPTTKENGTGSTNFLLTIPEEETDSYNSESSDSQGPSTYVRRTCSDQTITSKKLQPRCCHYSSHGLEYHCSPDGSVTDKMSNENDSIPVRPDSIVVSKILGIQKKISIILDSILYELDRIPLPDGDDDLLRRQQRVAEFSTRLSRNYLYDLSRQISEIKRHIKAITPNNNVKLSRRTIIIHMQAIEQKLISAHQLLLTALSAYWKHIPSSVLKNHPGKLKDILQVVIHLKNICYEIQLTSELYCSGDEKDTFLGKETESRCAAILSKFRPNSGNESQAQCHTTRSIPATPPRGNKKRNRKMITNRFNMYAIDMKLAKAYLPKRTHSMFQLSKDKKHIGQISKQFSSNGLSGSKKSNIPLVGKTSNEVMGTKVIKINVPPKEDDIQTMIQTVQPDLDAESFKSLKLDSRSDIAKRILHEKYEIYKNTKESQRLQKNKITNENDIKKDSENERQFSSLLPVIEDLLSQVKNNPNNTKLIPTTSIEAVKDYVKTFHPKPNTNESCAFDNKNKIETGDKNMRLICCTSTKEDYSNEKCFDKQNSKDEKSMNASCQAQYLKRDPSYKLLVPESAKLCITDFRNQYQSSLESSPMYTSSGENKPWEIVGWIADKLVDELIIELADDFQIDDVIKKLLDLEFQEF